MDACCSVVHIPLAVAVVGAFGDIDAVDDNPPIAQDDRLAVQHLEDLTLHVVAAATF